MYKNWADANRADIEKGQCKSGQCKERLRLVDPDFATLMSEIRNWVS